jgi:hypothetical protein
MSVKIVTATNTGIKLKAISLDTKMEFLMTLMKENYQKKQIAEKYGLTNSAPSTVL